MLFLGPGLGSIAAVTMTGVEEYDTTLLSVHMIQHMMLSMIAPIFLALGAPVTLALRTLPPRGRKALLAVVHSRVARVLAFPWSPSASSSSRRSRCTSPACTS